MRFYLVFILIFTVTGIYTPAQGASPSLAICDKELKQTEVKNMVFPGITSSRIINVMFTGLPQIREAKVLTIKTNDGKRFEIGLNKPIELAAGSLAPIDSANIQYIISKETYGDVIFPVKLYRNRPLFDLENVTSVTCTLYPNHEVIYEVSPINAD